MSDSTRFCSLCKVSAICMGNPFDAIRASKAYFCRFCEQLVVGNKKMFLAEVCALFTYHLAAGNIELQSMPGVSGTSGICLQCDKKYNPKEMKELDDTVNALNQERQALFESEHDRASALALGEAIGIVRRAFPKHIVTIEENKQKAAELSDALERVEKLFPLNKTNIEKPDGS